jgi:hypothetical protein
MILIDSNALIVLVVGLVDKSLINKHKRTSIYTTNDFVGLLSVIGDLKKLIVLPNIWTETDNLLNSFSGDYKWKYIQVMEELVKQSTEEYLESYRGIINPLFWELGLTDSLIIELGKKCDFIITADSGLSDFAIANGIPVYDMVQRRNLEFK